MYYITAQPIDTVTIDNPILKHRLFTASVSLSSAFVPTTACFPPQCPPASPLPSALLNTHRQLPR